ncbi:hypothetical protein RJT34_12443 [Clitoria ternatea]|uniref:Uncharacterized protein n=1 Tax=Clitoria ternatea TaxID=43366 RepID=A0AAN9JNY0_CLITE
MAESDAEGATALLNFQPKFNHEAKLKELLHRITSLEIELCADATEEFKKLLKAEKGGVLLHSLLESPIHLLLSKAARDVSKFATVALVDVDSKDIQVYIKDLSFNNFFGDLLHSFASLSNLLQMLEDILIDVLVEICCKC